MKTVKSQLSIEQVKKILRPQFEYLAKSYGEPLWLHSFSVWSILSKLVAHVPRFTDKEKLLMELAALLHDIGKMRLRSQLILAKGSGATLKHTATKEEIETYLRSFILSGLLELTKGDIDSIWEFALHHHLSDDQLKEAQIPAFGVYAEVVRFADWLSSMERLEMSSVMRIADVLKGICQLTVFGLGRYASPTTHCLLQTAIEKYRTSSWETLVILDDGVIFIGDKDAGLPRKREIAEEFADLLVKQSFEGHSIQIKFIRYEVLSGEAAQDPKRFLLQRKDYFIDKMGTIEEGAVLFFRTLMDLYKNAGQLSDQRRREFPILNILAKAGGTNGIKQAQELWSKRRRTRISRASTNEFVVDIFNHVTLKEVLLDSGEAGRSRYLRDMTAIELFDVLLKVASTWFDGKKKSAIVGAINSIISMEEETDFGRIAKETLERYKSYKKSRRPTKALCEHCGSTVTVKATSSLNFPTKSTWTGFTQINPNPDSGAPRIVCPFCVFDATKLRPRDLSYKKSQIYVRVSSRIPELWQLYGDLKTSIGRLYQSLTNVQEIKDLSETEFADLPLPPKFEIPVRKGYRDISFEIPIRSERGTLFPLDRVSIDSSPKDLRAKCLAFYALLNLMGLETHLGLDEQEGLFGEKIFEKRSVDWQTLYYEGLVTTILATSIRERKRNRYIYARNLLEKTPSGVLSKLENAGIKKELLEKVMLFLLRVNLKLSNERRGQNEGASKGRQVFRRRNT